MESIMRRLLLLDLDGTVVDSLGFIMRCFREAVDPYTRNSPSDAEIVATFGPAEDQCIAIVLQQHHQRGWLRVPYTHEIAQQAAKRFHQLYASGYEAGLVECYPGMVELVMEARQQGRATGIFTGKGRSSALATLDYVKLLTHFDAVVTSDDVEHPKPAADGVLLACRLTGVAPQHTLYVGDNPTDVIAGRRAGVCTAAAMWGAVFPEETLAVQPDYILQSPAELQLLLAKG